MKIKDFLKPHKKLLFISGIVLFLGGSALLWNTWPYTEYKGLSMRQEWNIADNIANSPNHKIFANGLYDFDYYTFLRGDGPFTVFLPTDKGYSKLSSELKYFLNDNKNNQGSIRQVLLYHVVKGRYLASDLKDGMQLETVEGEKMIVTRVSGQWVINGAAFIETRDIITKNGVIHIIDKYLLPPSIAALEANEN
jgi:uncharacterized surface protein with fasciclin (FAS1) repeats